MRRPPRYDDPPELRTAHDVRRLACCEYCGGSGDTKNMIELQRRGWVHGRCYVAEYGIGNLLHQPMSVLEKLTLGDIGVDAMKAILEMRNA